MNKISITFASLIFLLPMSSNLLAQDEGAMEAAEAECITKAEDNNISDDKFDDYVKECVAKLTNQ